MTTINVWNGSEWVSVGGVGPTGPEGPAGPAGSATLAGLTDVDVAGVADGQILIWEDASDTWVVGDPPEGGGGAALTVEASGGTPVTAVDRLVFPAGTVVDLGSGDVSVRELPTGAVGAVATKNAAVQSIGAAWTKVTLDTAEWDTGPYFDNANDRMTVPAGHRGPHLVIANGFSLGSDTQVAIYKNGADWRRAQHPGSGGQFQGPVVALDAAAVPGDYYELWMYNGGGAANVGHASVDSAETRLAIYKLGSGNVSGLDTARARRTSGNLTLNSTTWANVDTGLDLVVPAQAGDVLHASFSGLWGGEAVAGVIDVATIVAGSPVNYFGSAGGASGLGLGGLFGPSTTDAGSENFPIGGAAQYAVQSGDISGGTVTLRLRYRTGSASNKTLFGTTDIPFQWSVVNLRGGAVPRGALVKQAYAYSTGAAFDTSSITAVDTGVELAFTPTYADSVLEVEVAGEVNFGRAGAGTGTSLSFLQLWNATAAAQVALAVGGGSSVASGFYTYQPVTVRGMVVAGSTAARTYKLRVYAADATALVSVRRDRGPGLLMTVREYRPA